MIDENSFKKISFFILLAILTILSFIMLWSILTSVITGLLLAYVFYPAYKKTLSIFKEKNISAFIIILLVFVIIFLPLWFLMPFVFNQLFDIYLYMQKINLQDIVKMLSPYVSELNLSKDFTASLNSFIINFAGKLFSSSTAFIINIPSLLLKTVVVLFIFFFGMRDGEILIKYLIELSPFSKHAEKEFVEKFRGITDSVIYGFVVIGILQGILTGLGLFIFGIPHSILLTVIAIIAAMIPVLGAWLVWIPAVVYLFISGKTVFAVILLVYCAVIVSWIDNILRPHIVAKRVQISSAVIFVGMIGGLLFMGVLGLILGPLILAYLLLILDAYKERRINKLFS